jgi:hypothetical protein
MADNKYINIKINFKDGNICFTKNENKRDNEMPPSPFKIDDKTDNNLYVEYGIAKVFHKVLNLIKEEPELFQEDDFELLGEMLSRILFGKINNNIDGRNYALKEIEQTMDISNAAGEKQLRIFLEFDQKSNLAMLPWEYALYKPRSTNEIKPIYISASKKSRFHLMRRIMNNECPASKTEKLFVILLLSLDGNGDAIPAIDSRNSEEKAIVKVFNDLKIMDNGKNNDKVIVEVIKGTPLSKIKKEVEDIYKKWQAEYNESPRYILHYAGHANLEKEIGKLVIKDEQSGKSQWVEDQKFAALFSSDKLNVPQPFIVCFQACDSAKIGTIATDLRGVAYEFTKLNIPAVLGMQNEINTPHSCAFFDQFYTHILEGKDVAESVTAGRDFLGREYNPVAPVYSNNSFGSPVLFITTEEPVTLLKTATPAIKQDQPIEAENEFYVNLKPSDITGRQSMLTKEDQSLAPSAGKVKEKSKAQALSANIASPEKDISEGETSVPTLSSMQNN